MGLTEDKRVSAVLLANVANQWLEAYVDVELSCPPDDSDSWPQDTKSLLSEREITEQRYIALLEQANKYGVDIDV